MQAAIACFLLAIEQRLDDPAGRGLLEKNFLWWLFEPIDRVLEQLPLLRECHARVKVTGARGINHLQKRHKKVYELAYEPLGPQSRAAIRRLLRLPRSEATLYGLLSQDAWISFAGRFSGQSRFGCKGFGAYLKSKEPHLYSRILERNAEQWSHHISLDGHRYESRAELIIVNLLHANDAIVQYTPHPILPFKLPWSAKCMRGDFIVEPLNREDLPERFVVECWGRRADTSCSDRDDRYVAWTLLRRRYKLARRALYPGQLVEIEAEVLRSEGPSAFLEHCKGQFSSHGLQLDATGVDVISRWCRPPDEVPPPALAREIQLAGHTSVNAARRGS